MPRRVSHTSKRLFRARFWLGEAQNIPINAWAGMHSRTAGPSSLGPVPGTGRLRYHVPAAGELGNERRDVHTETCTQNSKRSISGRDMTGAGWTGGGADPIWLRATLKRARSQGCASRGGTRSPRNKAFAVLSTRLGRGRGTAARHGARARNRTHVTQPGTGPAASRMRSILRCSQTRALIISILPASAEWVLTSRSWTSEATT